MGLTNAEKQAAFTARKKQDGLRQYKVWLSEKTVQDVEACYPGQKRLDVLALAIMDSIQPYDAPAYPPSKDIAKIEACVSKWREQITEKREKSPRWENANKLLLELEEIIKSS